MDIMRVIVSVIFGITVTFFLLKGGKNERI